MRRRRPEGTRPGWGVTASILAFRTWIRSTSASAGSRRFLALLLSATLTGCGSTEPVPPEPQSHRIVTFGDSNTDRGVSGTAFTEASYISNDWTARLGPAAPHGATQLAGKIEALSTRTDTLHAVNHAISGSNTGAGKNDVDGSANARGVWHGVTRFEAEVLGLGAPTWDTEDGLPRVQAFTPSPRDFAYVSMGTNDYLVGIQPTQTVANLGWMADRWIHAGLPASHFIVTTLPPAALPGYAQAIPAVNDGLRQMAQVKGLALVDLAAHVSTDNGASWRSAALHIGDGVHYTESVRDWLASEVARIVAARP